jgi:hypothetical protein
LIAKFERNVRRRLPVPQADALRDLFDDAPRLHDMPVSRFMETLQAR